MCSFVLPLTSHLYPSPVQAHSNHRQCAAGPVCVWPERDIRRLPRQLRRRPTWLSDTVIRHEVHPPKACSQTGRHHHEATHHHQIRSHCETQTHEAHEKPRTWHHRPGQKAACHEWKEARWVQLYSHCSQCFKAEAVELMCIFFFFMFLVAQNPLCAKACKREGTIKSAYCASEFGESPDDHFQNK